MRGLVALAMLLLSTALVAQPYTGDIYSVTGEGILFRTDRAGKVTSLAYAATLSDGIAVAWDNQGILWTEWGNALARTPSRIHEWRNDRDTVLFSTTDFQIEELVVNQNGEIVFTGADRSVVPNVTGVFTWHGGAAVTTIVTTVAFGVSRPFLDGGMDIDIRTGRYLVTAGFLAFPQKEQIWAIAPDGSVTSVVTSVAAASGLDSRASLHQDKYDGTIVQSGFNSYAVVDLTGFRYVIQPRHPGPITPDMYFALRMDRASVPDSQRNMHAIFHDPNPLGSGIHSVSDPTKSRPIVTSVALTQSINVIGARGMVFADEKNIGSMKTGPGTYTLNFNFPGEGGKRYAVGISVSGHHPGITLADGRHVCLNVDALTFASLHNLLRPAFDPGPGTLDSSGNATGSIALGVDELNVLIHMVAMTMSSSTIDTISSPIVLRL